MNFTKAALTVLVAGIGVGAYADPVERQVSQMSKIFDNGVKTAAHYHGGSAGRPSHIGSPASSPRPHLAPRGTGYRYGGIGRGSSWGYGHSHYYGHHPYPGWGYGYSYGPVNPVAAAIAMGLFVALFMALILL